MVTGRKQIESPTAKIHPKDIQEKAYSTATDSIKTAASTSKKPTKPEMEQVVKAQNAKAKKPKKNKRTKKSGELGVIASIGIVARNFWFIFVRSSSCLFLGFLAGSLDRSVTLSMLEENNSVLALDEDVVSPKD